MSTGAGRIDWADTGLRLEDTELTKAQVNLLLPDDLTTWTSAEVAQWVRSLNPTFGPEAAIFDDEGIDGEMLLTLDDQIMKEELNIVSTLHRKKILSNIEKRKAEWDLKYATPPPPAREPSPEPEIKKTKSSRPNKKSQASSKSSSKAMKRSKSARPRAKTTTAADKKSKRVPKSSKKSGGGSSANLDDATITEVIMTDFLKFAGMKKKDLRDIRVLFRYMDRKKKKEISGKVFRKTLIRFIPSKTEEKIRNKILKLVKENQIEKKWKEFVQEDGGGDNGGGDEEVSDGGDEVASPPPPARQPSNDPDYDAFYDSPIVDDIDPYQLKMDMERQATIIVAQKNRIHELEDRVQKQLDLHAMEVRQLEDKHREQLKRGEKHLEKQMQALRDKHLQELGGVRDRAKNMKNLGLQKQQFSTSSVDGLDEQMKINSELRVKIRDLEKELSTAKEFLENAADETELVRVRAQLDTAVEMIGEKERALVTLTKEKEELLDMCKELINGGGPQAQTEEKLRQLQKTPSHSEIRSRDEIATALEQAAVRNEEKSRRVRHVRGESIDQFKERLSLLVKNADGGGSAKALVDPETGDINSLLASDELNESSFLRDD